MNMTVTPFFTLQDENEGYWLEVVICPRCKKNYCMRCELVNSTLDGSEICPNCYEKESESPFSFAL